MTTDYKFCTNCLLIRQEENLALIKTIQKDESKSVTKLQYMAKNDFSRKRSLEWNHFMHRHNFMTFSYDTISQRISKYATSKKGILNRRFVCFTIDSIDLGRCRKISTDANNNIQK